MDKDVIRERLLANLPPIFGRKAASEATGGLYSAGYLANLDSLGAGPPSFRTGRKTAYERYSFVEWFLTRTEDRVLQHPVPRKRGR